VMPWQMTLVFLLTRMLIGLERVKGEGAADKGVAGGAAGNLTGRARIIGRARGGGGMLSELARGWWRRLVH
jgi:hypothetical protein